MHHVESNLSSGWIHLLLKRLVTYNIESQSNDYYFLTTKDFDLRNMCCRSMSSPRMMVTQTV